MNYDGTAQRKRRRYQVNRRRLEAAAPDVFTGS